MAVDVYSEKLNGINSPSFSFSNDNYQINYNPSCRLELDHSVLDSPFDFAFNVDTTISSQSSTADELFSNGKLIPSAVKKESKEEIIQDSPCLHSESNSRIESRKKSLKEYLEDYSDDEEPDIVVTKPFWMFRRSNSLNSDRNPKKSGLIGSWKILSRSGSTGKFLEKILEEDEKKPSIINHNLGLFRKFSRSNSLSNSDCNVGSKNGANVSSEELRRSNSTSDYNYFSKSDRKSFRRSKSTGCAPNHVRNKQQQQERFPSNGRTTQNGNVKNGNRNSFGDYYSKSGKVNPILNYPSPYISRVSVDLFGIGSLFCNGNIKYRKKKK